MINKKSADKLLIFIASAVLLVSFAVLVSALADDEKTALQSELDNLTQYLNDNNYDNYDWLIDYNISYPSVRVFRENSNELLAEFRDILGGSNFNKYQIFLTSLNENETQDVFDLRSFGDVERINYDVLQKKIRIDEIRKELNPEGGNV